MNNEIKHIAYDSTITCKTMNKNRTYKEIKKIIDWYKKEYDISFNSEWDIIIYVGKQKTTPKSWEFIVGFNFLPFKEFIDFIENLGWTWILGDYNFNVYKL